MNNCFTVELADRFIKALIEAVEITKDVKINYKLERVNKKKGSDTSEKD